MSSNNGRFIEGSNPDTIIMNPEIYASFVRMGRGDYDADTVNVISSMDHLIRIFGDHYKPIKGRELFEF